MNPVLSCLILPISIVISLTTATLATREQSITLMDIYHVIEGKQFVDLTHTFSAKSPHWKGDPVERVTTTYWYDPKLGTLGSGFFAQEFCHVGQWGTHVDPPAHFAKGGRTVDQIRPKEMLMPLVVISAQNKVARNPDYTLTMNDIRDWESRHGAVPANAFVAMRTDWSDRWPNNDAMENRDAKGVFHTPGWSMHVLRYLFEQRHITAVGHETLDADPGSAETHDDYSLESYILHSNHYEIALLGSLKSVPESGALVVVSFPKPKGGSGFPARVFAILP